MTVQEMLKEIDDHGFEDLPHNRKIAAINDAYFDIVTREPWPFLEKEVNISLSSGGDGLAMPSNFDKVISLTLYNTDQTEGRKLRWVRQDTIDESLPTDFVGRPLYYYFVGENVYTFPESDSNYVANLVYLAKPTALEPIDDEDDILLPSQHHQVICFGALAQLFLFDQNFQAADKFEQLFERRILAMRDNLWRRNFETDIILNVDELDVYPEYLY